MTTEVIAAGFTNVYIGVLDTDGMSLGFTTSLNAGDQNGAGMRRFEGAKNGPISVPEPDTVTPTGDDEPKGNFTFESTTLASGVLTTSIKDMNIEAMCMGLEVVNMGMMQIVVTGQPENPQRRDMCLILQRRSISRTAGEVGVSRWSGVYIPKATITPMGAPFEERAAATYSYKITLNKSDRMLWGETFGVSVHGTEQAAFYQFISEYPIVQHSFRGDGAETVFNLALTPAGTTSNYLRAWKAGVYQSSGVTVNAAAKTVTFAAAPAADQIVNVAYQYTT